MREYVFNWATLEKGKTLVGCRKTLNWFYLFLLLLFLEEILGAVNCTSKHNFGIILLTADEKYFSDHQNLRFIVV